MKPGRLYKRTFNSAPSFYSPPVPGTLLRPRRCCYRNLDRLQSSRTAPLFAARCPRKRIGVAKLLFWDGHCRQLRALLTQVANCCLISMPNLFLGPGGCGGRGGTGVFRMAAVCACHAGRGKCLRSNLFNDVHLRCAWPADPRFSGGHWRHHLLNLLL